MSGRTGSDRESGSGDDHRVLPDHLVRRLRTALLASYDARARDLPWRRTDDPYRIWVSEVMLQQTRVDVVVPYYERWIERFPDVESLAAADLDEVLKLWEGLGYYRRARSLHRAACVVRDRRGGFPDTAASLEELPGVGPYTAGAVASIAFGRAEPAVDGNVRRVLARVLDLADPAAVELRELARTLVPDERPGDFNQALMELGATLCTPRRPDCRPCPVADCCRARARGIQEERPAPRPRADVPRARLGVAVLVRDEGSGGSWSVALVRRPEDGMLGGLWEFPGAVIEEGEDAVAAARRAAAQHGIEIGGAEGSLPVVDHTYSHLRARYRPYLFRVEGSGVDGARSREVRWMDSGDLAAAALPRAQRTIADRLPDVVAPSGDRVVVVRGVPTDPASPAPDAGP